MENTTESATRYERQSSFTHEIAQNRTAGFINNSVNKIAEKTYGYISDKIRDGFGKEIFFCDDHYETFRCAEKWIYEKDKDKYEKNVRQITTSSSNIMDLNCCKYYIKLNKGTFCKVSCEIREFNNGIKDKYIYLYLFGKKYQYYLKEIYSYIINKQDFKDKQFVMTCDQEYNYSPQEEKILKRKFNTVFMDDDKKLEIINYVHKWEKNKDIFTSRGLSYKTGILLYGAPGTGKTSICKAIAAELNSPLLIVDLTAINEIRIGSIIKHISYRFTNTLVVLLEDIDCIVCKREDSDNEEQKINEKRALNKLLQLLDGANSPTNIIFVATTNYYDKLDEALKRDGRFDLKIKIDNISINEATKMCKSFDLNDDDINIILGNNIDFNPSQLQNKIIRYILNR
jgi:SpoVK/Ycf46/Vps4 family AAA+-type ATPase